MGVALLLLLLHHCRMRGESGGPDLQVAPASAVSLAGLPGLDMEQQPAG